MIIEVDPCVFGWDLPLGSLFEDGVVRLHRVERQQEVDVSGVVVPPRSLIKTHQQSPPSPSEQSYFRTGFHGEMSEIVERGRARVVER